jgi:flavodoxin
MTRTLVAFHSRSGYTRRVAQALARALHADLVSLEPVRIRRGALGYLRCALEAVGRVEPEIRRPAHDAADYDLLVIGTPVWFWRLASPVRTYAAHHARRTRRVAFFCTMGSQGSEGVLAELAALTGRAPEATLALTDREIDQGYVRRLDAFVRALQRRPHASHRRGRAHPAALAASSP